MVVKSRRRPNGLKVDPTRTATLRRQVQADLRSRFATLRQRVGRLVVAEDVFGLRPSAHDPFTMNMKDALGHGSNPRGGPAPRPHHPTVEAVRDAVKDVFKEDRNPKNGGECGSVALTLCSIHPELRAFAITTEGPKGYGRGISHFVVSGDGGKTFFDGQGKVIPRAKVLDGYPDRPEIHPALYHHDATNRTGGYYRTHGTAEEFDAGIWKDFHEKVVSKLAAKGPTGNAVGAVTAHKPAGPGGGQFTSGSGGPSAGKAGGAGKRFTGKLLARLKGAGAKAGHVEHAAKEWAAAKVQRNVEKLPPRTQRAVKAAFTVGKVATKAAFATWTAGQHLAERVARERGATPEQAAKLRGVLSSLDMATFKPVSIGLGATGLGAATIGAASMIPPATAGYLTYSTARNPLATMRAAKGMVSDALARVSGGKGKGGEGASKEPVRPSAKLGSVSALPSRNALLLNADSDPSDGPDLQMTRLVAAALELHDYSDWYVALLSAALDATGDVGDAIDLANEVAGENPEDVSAPAADDEAAVIQRPNPFRNGQPQPSSPVENVRWKFHDLTSKVRAFLDWFGAQVRDVFADAPALLSGAARQAFGKGVGRTYDDARKPLSDPGRDAMTLAAGAREEFLRSTLSLPQEADRLRALGQRAAADLTNALGDATTRAGRAVTDGLSRGESPAELAKGLYAAIDEGSRRAAAVAHDVVVRSQAEGQLSAAESLGAREEAVEAEWLTARDGRVCTLCASYAGRSMPVARARGLIPLHVSCRCAWVPKWVLPSAREESTAPPILNVLRDARTIDRFDALLTEVLRNATAGTVAVTNDVVDKFKHAHKGVGPGGGQFTSKGGAPSVPAAGTGSSKALGSSLKTVRRSISTAIKTSAHVDRAEDHLAEHAGRLKTSRENLSKASEGYVRAMGAHRKEGSAESRGDLRAAKNTLEAARASHDRVKADHAHAVETHYQATQIHQSALSAYHQAEAHHERLTKALGGKAARARVDKEAADREATLKQSTTEGKTHDDGPAGRGGVRGADAVAGGHVANPLGGAGTPGPGQVGGGHGQPAGPTAPARVPSHQPAEIGKVNARIDRFVKTFRSAGNHQAAEWLGKLKEHVNTVGVKDALEAVGGHGGKGVGPAAPKKANYEGGWDKAAFEHGEGGHHLAAFCESYLNRVGITMSHQLPEGHAEGLGGKGPTPAASPHATPHVSSMSPSQGGTKGAGHAKDFTPADPTLKHKLEEAQHLPGLEKSQDVNVLAGKAVTHLTPEFQGKLDAHYGKDAWIVKAYGDEAAAGYGIFFPQRARQIQHDAQNTIWAAGEHLAKYGFTLGRHADTHEVQGLIHANGDHYHFESKEYDSTIHGDAKHWAEKAREASANEHGAQLPGGGKEFMAQPAFKAVGVSEADRAAGKTIAPGEGRVHITTRDGVASVIPHSTWIKGEHLPVVFESHETKAMAQAALDAIHALPHSERRGQIYAPDVIKAEGGYKVVEANPANHTGSSGYLGNNPMVIDSYVSHLTGQQPAHVRFIQRLLSSRGKAE